MSQYYLVKLDTPEAVTRARDDSTPLVHHASAMIRRGDPGGAQLIDRTIAALGDGIRRNLAGTRGFVEVGDGNTVRSMLPGDIVSGPLTNVQARAVMRGDRRSWMPSEEQEERDRG